jgi:hypothetical protein
VANRALELRMAQEELHSAQILGPSIDQRRLGTADGMGSVSGSRPISSTQESTSILSDDQMRGCMPSSAFAPESRPLRPAASSRLPCGSRRLRRDGP